MVLAFQVILTVAEHHSCIVPWQIVSQKTGAVLKFVTLNEDEVPDIDMLREMISEKTKLVAVHHVSNVLGRYLFSSSHYIQLGLGEILTCVFLSV